MNSSVKFLSPSVIAGLPLPGWPAGAALVEAELEVPEDPPPQAATVTKAARTSPLQSARLFKARLTSVLPFVDWSRSRGLATSLRQLRDFLRCRHPEAVRYAVGGSAHQRTRFREPPPKPELGGRDIDCGDHPAAAVADRCGHRHKTRLGLLDG